MTISNRILSGHTFAKLGFVLSWDTPVCCRCPHNTVSCKICVQKPVKHLPAIPEKTADMASFLTEEEAFHFVENDLGISACKSLVQGDRFKLLSLITLRLHETSPFNNFFLMAEKPAARKRPSWEKVKSQMLSGAGGLCYVKNLFTFRLLRSLGYEVKALLACAGGQNTHPDHIMIAVMDVKMPGDRFLVDVGVGFPCFEPIDLSFQKESPVFVQSFMRIKYTREGNSVLRLNQDRVAKNDDNCFRKFITCPLTYYEPEEIMQCFDRVYEDPKTTMFHSVLRCIQYPESKAKVLYDATSKIENEQGELVDYPLETNQAMLAYVNEQFPTIPSGVVAAAIESWRKLKTP